MFEIREIDIPKHKSEICGTILRELPSWFGVESSIVDYIKTTAQMPFFAAFKDNKPVGLVAIKEHGQYASEIFVMGILAKYHRLGIGRSLIQHCEKFCVKKGNEFLTVKTLDESRKSGSYEKTRRFYLALGFRALEVFPLYWDENNPCLFMSKYIGSICDRS